jgi:hypothetical protein
MYFLPFYFWLSSNNIKLSYRVTRKIKEREYFLCFKILVID